jgi:hypothetical protein
MRVAPIVWALASCAVSAPPRPAPTQPPAPRPRGNDDAEVILTKRVPPSGQDVAPPFPFKQIAPTRLALDNVEYELSAPLSDWDVARGPRLSMRFPPGWDVDVGTAKTVCSLPYVCSFSSVPALLPRKQWITDHWASIDVVAELDAENGDPMLLYRDRPVGDDQWAHVLRWHNGNMFRFSYRSPPELPGDFYVVMHTMQWK